MTDELAIRKRLREDFELYASKHLFIRTKAGEIEALKLNRVQRHLHSIAQRQRRERGKVRIIGLKGRQQGFSTFVGGRLYWRVTHGFGLRAFILTHLADATANLFGMTKRYHGHCPAPMQPALGASSQRELTFPKLDSSYRVGTAGSDGVGRSETIQLFHGSEVAYWPNADQHATGVLQAVPDAHGTEVWLESTANGVGNYFHHAWQMAETGESDFEAVFVPWFWTPEYARDAKDFIAEPDEQELAQQFGLTIEQLAWRRAKLKELGSLSLFKREYPCTAAEAFESSADDAYIQPALVMRARKATMREGHGPLIIGADPSRFGDDSFAVAWRRGRVCERIETLPKANTMESAGRLAMIIDADKPAALFIDVGGLGVGIYDRLCELGYSRVCTPINFGAEPTEVNRYRNKRAEIWGRVREWLEDPGGCAIPDDDRLHADLSSPGYKYDSLQRLLIESKEEMRKRGLRSPDYGDALALTFSHPIMARVEDTKDRYRARARQSGWMAA